MEKTKILPFPVLYTTLQGIWLGAISQRMTAHDFTYMWNLENKRKIVSYIEQIYGCQRAGVCEVKESKKVKVKVKSCPTLQPHGL